jgi:transposase
MGTAIAEALGSPRAPSAEQRTIVWVHESAFYPRPAVVRTWAPRGVSPVLRALLTRDHLSVISGITPAGQLLLQMQDRSPRGPDVVRFLRHLLRHIPGQLLVIWDGAPIHRTQAVKDFLAHGGAVRIWLEWLPAYAPELNPEEGIWSYLKRGELRNLFCDDLDELRLELRLAAARLRQQCTVIAGCISQCGYAV